MEDKPSKDMDAGDYIALYVFMIIVALIFCKVVFPN